MSALLLKKKAVVKNDAISAYLTILLIEIILMQINELNICSEINSDNFNMPA